MTELKCYDPNFQGTHIVQATFMQWDYVGHVAYEMSGNSKGENQLHADFLDLDTQDEIDQYVINDCDFTAHCDEDEYFFSATLRNAEGDELRVEGDAEDFKRMIIKIEFIGLRGE